MANKKFNKKPIKTSENRNAARRTRILQIIFAVFSIMLILSMILSLTSY
ncbi:MAG TPA: hypothetical protein VFY83_04980 [Anaerolineales bacterium]|nr:hypothetical protein [Anaerolineales bacterium]